ncbi:magnesium transporter MRS2-5 isoform X3 [Syzygium oleosum]|uniref:magnesium transporter MRS2-5 isoform X3 n=1 Tax=Syzygium oleosum TaxID=219896 RepID=UPI0024BA9B3F|nr:magnesium transporter MRS2-5 isoform X3 [Syzygium oleosum]
MLVDCVGLISLLPLQRERLLSMEGGRGPIFAPIIAEPGSSQYSARFSAEGYGSRASNISSAKKRGHGSRSWIKIDQEGNSKVLELDKATIMRHCSLPARDLRLLDPLFIYPSTILGRGKAIVVSLEQIRCIITADEVFLMNSLDGCVLRYESELRRSLQTNKDQTDDLPFEFRALELALELTCTSLDAQVKDLEMEIYPVLDELITSVRDEIEHLMDDDGDMAEMYLTEKKQSSEAYSISDQYIQTDDSGVARLGSKSAPVSPVASLSGGHKLQRAFSSIISSSKHGSFLSSSSGGENIDQLEMLLEAYFVVIDNTLSKLLSLKEYIDDTEDMINIKLGNIQNHLIQFELLLTAATFVATIFAVVAGIFGMNFAATIFDYPSVFNWVLLVTGIFCAGLYFSFLFYFRYKKVFPL